MADAALEEPGVLCALAHGFLEDLQRHFPHHRLIIQGQSLIEGETDVARPCATSWRQVTVWYNLLFQPRGIRIQSNWHDFGQFCLAYHEPDLFDRLVEILATLINGTLSKDLL